MNKEICFVPHVMPHSDTLNYVAGLVAAAEIQLPSTNTDFCSASFPTLRRLLVMDGIQDPGNIGTLLRTALALGWQGAFLLPGRAQSLLSEHELAFVRGRYDMGLHASQAAAILSMKRHCEPAEEQPSSCH